MGALSHAALGAFLVSALGCSPEARRERDGGPGADPGNKDLMEWRGPEPIAADTSLWPGKEPAPVERLARGEVLPPTYPSPEATTRPAEAQQRAFDQTRRAHPKEQSDSGR